MRLIVPYQITMRIFAFARAAPLYEPVEIRATCSRRARFYARARARLPGRSRSAKRTALYEALNGYAAHFSALLDVEREAEHAAALAGRDRPREELEAAGVAVFGLTVHCGKRVYTNAVYELRSKSRLWHRLSAGDLVALVAGDESVEATVMRCGAYSIRVAVPHSGAASQTLHAAAEDDQVLDVYRGANAVVYLRGADALRRVSMRPVTQVARLVGSSLGNSDESASRRPVMRMRKAEGDWEEMAAERVRGGSAKWKGASTLNRAQEAAVRAALSRTLTLIHGPPGTGKTVTAAHVVAGAVLEGRGPVLAVAASNAAADALTEAILRITTSTLIRVGRLGAVRESLWRYTLDALIERDAGVRRAIQKGRGIGEAQIAASKRAIAQSQIVVTTCAAAGRDTVLEATFPFVVADEAAQATEPDVLIALDGATRQLVLAGDHHQLPPTVLADNASALGVSMFARLWDAGVASWLLDTQYRMHPHISNFPSSHFYDNLLRDAVTAEARVLPNTLRKLNATRTVFVDVQGEEMRGTMRDSCGTRAGFSYANQAEAHAVVRLLRALLNDAFDAKDVGVISPYAAQTRAIARMASTWSECEIDTVDGFQGREKEAIVISTVRCNVSGEVGFLGDWRRLNVALTRARTLLVVIGCERTLRRDQHWGAWLRSVHRSKARISLNTICANYDTEDPVGS